MCKITTIILPKLDYCIFFKIFLFFYDFVLKRIISKYQLYNQPGNFENMLHSLIWAYNRRDDCLPIEKLLILLRLNSETGIQNEDEDTNRL